MGGGGAVGSSGESVEGSRLVESEDTEELPRAAWKTGAGADAVNELSSKNASWELKGVRGCSVDALDSKVRSIGQLRVCSRKVVSWLHDHRKNHPSSCIVNEIRGPPRDPADNLEPGMSVLHLPTSSPTRL